jgi:hypothetical protein
VFVVSVVSRLSGLDGFRRTGRTIWTIWDGVDVANALPGRVAHSAFALGPLTGLERSRGVVYLAYRPQA